MPPFFTAVPQVVKSEEDRRPFGEHSGRSKTGGGGFGGGRVSGGQGGRAYEDKRDDRRDDRRSGGRER